MAFLKARYSKNKGLRAQLSNSGGAAVVAGAPPQAFFTNSDFSPIAPMPSILQSMS